MYKINYFYFLFFLFLFFYYTNNNFLAECVGNSQTIISLIDSQDPLILNEFYQEIITQMEDDGIDQPFAYANSHLIAANEALADINFEIGNHSLMINELKEKINSFVKIKENSTNLIIQTDITNANIDETFRETMQSQLAQYQAQRDLFLAKRDELNQRILNIKEFSNNYQITYDTVSTLARESNSEGYNFNEFLQPHWIILLSILYFSVKKKNSTSDEKNLKEDFKKMLSHVLKALYDKEATKKKIENIYKKGISGVSRFIVFAGLAAFFANLCRRYEQFKKQISDLVKDTKSGVLGTLAGRSTINMREEYDTRDLLRNYIERSVNFLEEQTKKFDNESRKMFIQRVKNFKTAEIFSDISLPSHQEHVDTTLDISDMRFNYINNSPQNNQIKSANSFFYVKSKKNNNFKNKYGITQGTWVKFLLWLKKRKK